MHLQDGVPMANGIQSLDPKDLNRKQLLALMSGEDPEEQAFREWLDKLGNKTGMSYDPDNPVYDYRTAYEAGDEPLLIPGDEDPDWEGIPYRLHHHWPSRNKEEGHPTEGAGEGIRGLLLSMQQRAEAQKWREGRR